MKPAGGTTIRFSPVSCASADGRQKNNATPAAIHLLGIRRPILSCAFTG